MSLPVRRVAILGGGGFFATHLAALLRQRHPECSIVAIDLRADLPPGRRIESVDYRLGVDLGNVHEVAGCIRGADAAVNTVGFVSFSRREAVRLFRVNADLALSSANACTAAGVPWLIHLSSVAALGHADKSAGPISEAFEFDWTAARRKRRYYMLSKREGDLLLAATGSVLERTTVFPGLMVGPGDLINTPRLYGAAAAAVSLAPPGVTNVVDVRDVAAGVIAILERRAVGKRLILGGANVSYRELFSLIRRHTGRAVPVIPVPEWLHAPLDVGFRVAEAIAAKPLMMTCANVDASFTWRAHSSKYAEQEIGYTPRYSIEQSFQDYLSGTPGVAQ